MREVEGATKCIENLNGMVLHGRAIRVDYSATHKAHAPTPGEYRGEKRPFEDRWGGDRRGDRYRGGDRWGGDRDRGDRHGDRYDGGDRDRDRRAGAFDRGDRWADRDHERGDRGGDRERGDRSWRPEPHRDDDPYGGRSRREEGGDRPQRPERPERADREDRNRDFERRRSPSPAAAAARRYSPEPERRDAPLADREREPPRPY
jgi:transformer-2 protein